MTPWIISWRHLVSTQQPPGGGAGGTYLTVVAGRPVRTVVVSTLLWVVVVALVTAVLEIEYLSEYFVSGTYDRFYIYLIVLSLNSLNLANLCPIHMRTTLDVFLYHVSAVFI